MTELVRVQGMTEAEHRMQTINFSGGKVNAAEWCQQVYHLPAFPELLQAFQEDVVRVVSDNT